MYSYIFIALCACLALAYADYGYGYDNYAADYYSNHPVGKAHYHYGLPAHAIVTRKNPKKVFLYADEGINKKGHNYGFFQGDEIGYAGSAITNNLGHSATDDKYSNDKYQHYTLTGTKGHRHHGDHLYAPKDKLHAKRQDYY